MWERRAHDIVGFGSTGRKRKGPCTKQCAWRKHGSCDTCLAEACPPKLWNTVKMSEKKRCAQSGHFGSAPCAQNGPGRSTMRLPEALLPRNPTRASSHFSGLTNEGGIGHYIQEIRGHYLRCRYITVTQRSPDHYMVYQPAPTKPSHKRVFTLICWQPGSANTGFRSTWAIS